MSNLFSHEYDTINQYEYIDKKRSVYFILPIKSSRF